MRRLAPFLVALVLVAAVGVPAAGASGARPASATAPRVVTMRAFCRSTDRFVHFLAHSPDPRKLAGAAGRRVLRAFHADAPPEIAAATGTVADSFGYLSRHGSLPKARDARTADALLHAAVFAASHCRQQSIHQLAQGLLQRRMARAEALNPPASRTSPTTTTR
jgi:hypothetical protein